MKKTITVIVIIGIVLILFFVLGPFYVLEEGQQAVVTRFGKIVSATAQAGLKFKMPLVDNVTKYSKRLLAWDGDAQRIPTQEKMFIWVDTTARWLIDDPMKFYESVTTMEGAFGRLDEVIDSSVRTVISGNLLREAVRNSNVINTINREDQIEQIQTEEGNLEDIASFTSIQETYTDIEKGRDALSKAMFDKASVITPQYGIILEDIIIRQIRYSDDLTQSVYDRMIKQRNQIAEAYRSHGEGMKAEWVGRMNNERQALLSKGYEQAEEIKGEADALATTIYAEAYEGDEEFFSFWRSIESYRKTLPKFSKTLTTDMDYFKYLYSSDGD